MITKEEEMSEHYNTFTWYDSKAKRKVGPIRKGLFLFGMLLDGALIIYVIVDLFEIITK